VSELTLSSSSYRIAVTLLHTILLSGPVRPKEFLGHFVASAAGAENYFFYLFIYLFSLNTVHRNCNRSVLVTHIEPDSKVPVKN